MKLIGGCRLNRISDIERYIGYLLSREHWGKVYATEKVKSHTNYGFNVFNLHLINATVHPENTASIKVLEKVGMRYEKD
jgi:ribosomal-protein-alanine N-acetyltransferase